MSCHFIEWGATEKKTEEKKIGCRLAQILTVKMEETWNPNGGIYMQTLR